MQAVRRHRSFLALALLFCAGGSSGNDDAAEATFYERKIAPVLAGKCAVSNTRSGCHVAADDRGNAFGNLNLESYATLALRRDLLVDYGPYGLPGLLLKVVPPFELRLTRWDKPEPILITTDIAHGGGALLDFTSSSFTQLERWIDNGAAENNAPPA